MRFAHVFGCHAPLMIVLPLTAYPKRMVKLRSAIPLPGGIVEAVRKLLYSHLILADSAPAMAIEEWK